jgi:16S rRNA U516 pseudouridylate synthase RsuA-like enzyme
MSVHFSEVHHPGEPQAKKPRMDHLTPSPSSSKLRLEKDPNLKSDFFWDLRKERLPLFRALQMAKFIVPSTEVRAIQHNNDQQVSEIIVPVERVPSKLDIKQLMWDNPESIRIVQRRKTERGLFDPTDCRSKVDSFECLVSERQDEIYIHKSAAAELLCSAFAVKCTKFEKETPPQRVETQVSPGLNQDDTWFRLGPRIAHQYVLLYKKRGVLSTCKRGPHDSSHVPTIANVLADISARVDTDTLVNPLRPLVHVGRLDLESEGLILLTNDGSFSRACTSPAVGLQKTYRVLVKSKGRRKWPTLQGENGQEGSHQDSLSRIFMDELQNRLSEITDQVHFETKDQDMLQNAVVSSQPPIDSTEISLDARRIRSQQGKATEEFRAESCSIVEFRVEESAKAHASQNNGLKAENSMIQSTSTAYTVFALLDVEMREGAKREVRRLMRSIDFVTLMLARTKIGTLDWNSLPLATNNTDDSPANWNFRIPQTIAEGRQKCLDYHGHESSKKSPKGHAASKLPVEAAADSHPFRRLDKHEVDQIFATVDSDDFFD